MFDFLAKKFSGVLSWLQDRGRLTEKNIDDALQQVHDALLEADVPLKTVTAFLEQVKQDLVGLKIHQALNPGQQVIKAVYDRVLNFLGDKNSLVTPTFAIPSVILIMGLQGSGKTTSLAKIANWTREQAEKRGKKRKILLASVDYYRPAAIEQLRILSQQHGLDFYQAQQSTQPVKAAQEIYDYFKKHSYEFLFLDTAGRLHIDKAMMDELIQINQKLAPKYKFLVLDAMTGQESLQVAQQFDEAIGFDSAVMSKMDSDARGGAAFGFRYLLKKPISFIGSGEKVSDLEPFIPERMASRILGMGDMLTLIEKATSTIDEKHQEDLSKRLMQGTFTLKDFADQISMINQLGSLQTVMRYLPHTRDISSDEIERGQVTMKQFKVIISSMTNKERLFPNILDASRKKRIARGAGVGIEDVNALLQRFEESKKMALMLKKHKMLRKFLKQ